MSDQVLRATEQWFIRRGLPFFVADYRSSTDVWTRASPVLSVIFIFLVVLSAVTIDDALGLAIGIVLLMLLGTGYVVWNLRRGESWRALPRRVSWPILVAFVSVPALVSLASSRSWTAFIGSAANALVVLAVTWLVTRYAILPLAAWAIRYTFRGVGDLFRLTTQALPLLLLFLTFLVFTTEVWQVAGGLRALHLWGVIATFVALGIVFVISRVPAEVRLIELATSRQQVIAACERTPLVEVVASLDALDTPIPLSRRQTANIGLVMTVAQLVQVALFAIVVWAFLVGFGALAISIHLQDLWMAGSSGVDVLWEIGNGYGVTRQLLRVSLFLAAFSGFYVTIYTASDASYREHFYDRIRRDLERSLSVRRAYLVLRRRG